MTTRCGYVAIIGRPNVGKSTLLNALVGQKISITTPKPQTTRTQIMGIKTTQDVQALYIDTPGIHENEKREANRYMNRLALAVIDDADVVVFMVEAMRWSDADELVFQKIKDTRAPVILAINKVDLVDDKRELLPFIESCQEKFSFAHIVPFSAKNSDNIHALEKIIFDFLPESPFLFPEDQITDKDDNFQIAEFIREKLIQTTQQEIPYSSNVEIESIKLEKNIYHVHATIWVERDGQKKIVIGKGGALLKLIGTRARKDIQKLLGKKIFLRLWVKVKDES
jgi:GTP-binding protein Era